MENINQYDYGQRISFKLPPVGTRVNIVTFTDMRYGEGETNCEVVSHFENCAIVRMSFGLGCFVKEALQPLDWDKLSKRKQAITYAMELSPDWFGLDEVFGVLYDVGMLKLPEDK